jgi:hypothetical protein
MSGPFSRFLVIFYPLSCQWSLMSLITGNKVKKKHTSQGIVKKKRTKPTKEF